MGRILQISQRKIPQRIKSQRIKRQLPFHFWQRNPLGYKKVKKLRKAITVMRAMKKMLLKRKPRALQSTTFVYFFTPIENKSLLLFYTHLLMTLHTHTHIGILTHAQMITRMRAHAYMYIRTHARMPTHTYVHTYTRSDARTYTRSDARTRAH